MQLTPNYKLKKPEGTDQVDIQDFNDNADLIDAALKKKSDSAGGDISEMTIKTLDSITTDFPIPEAGEKPREFLGKVKKFFVDTKNWMTGVCLIGSIVNNCVTDNARLPLSAAQGKVLMDLYTVLNTKITDIYRTQASNVTLTKRGNIVHASFSGQNISSNGAAGLIPEGYRPNSQHRFLSISFHSGGINNGIACVTVDTNGTVSCKNTSNVSANALLWSSTMWLI